MFWKWIVAFQTPSALSCVLALSRVEPLCQPFPRQNDMSALWPHMVHHVKVTYCCMKGLISIQESDWANDDRSCTLTLWFECALVWIITKHYTQRETLGKQHFTLYVCTVLSTLKKGWVCHFPHLVTLQWPDTSVTESTPSLNSA